MDLVPFVSLGGGGAFCAFASFLLTSGAIVYQAFPSNTVGINTDSGGCIVNSTFTNAQVCGKWTFANQPLFIGAILITSLILGLIATIISGVLVKYEEKEFIEGWEKLDKPEYKSSQFLAAAALSGVGFLANLIVLVLWFVPTLTWSMVPANNALPLVVTPVEGGLRFSNMKVSLSQNMGLATLIVNLATLLMFVVSGALIVVGLMRHMDLVEQRKKNGGSQHDHTGSGIMLESPNPPPSPSGSIASRRPPTT